LNPPLKFDSGGYVAGGKAMFDSECNLWVGDNFSVRWQGQDSLWQRDQVQAERQASLANHYRLRRRREMIASTVRYWAASFDPRTKIALPITTLN
jgi:hypothetical protein